MPANADVFAFTMCTMLVYNWRISKAQFITAIFLFNLVSSAVFPISLNWICFFCNTISSLLGADSGELMSDSVTGGFGGIWFSLLSFVFQSVKCRTQLGKDGRGRKHWPACSCVCMNQHVGLCSRRWMQDNKPSRSLFTVLFERKLEALSAELPICLGRMEKFISASRCLKMLINLYSLQTPANEIHTTAKEAKVMMLKQCESEHSCVLQWASLYPGTKDSSLRGVFSWSVFYVFHLKSENESMPWIRWPFQGNSARQSCGRVERCTPALAALLTPN